MPDVTRFNCFACLGVTALKGEVNGLKVLYDGTRGEYGVLKDVLNVTLLKISSSV